MAGVRAIALVLLALLCAGSLGCAVRSPADSAADAAQRAEVDRRIGVDTLRVLNDVDGLVVNDLQVEIADGVVTLSGFQPDLPPVSEALRRVAEIRGVRGVVNRVRIRGPANR